MKTCIHCSKAKDYSEFGKRNRNIDGLQNMCKSCKRIYDNSRYSDLPLQKKENKQSLNQSRKRLIHIACINYKLSKGCIDCGYKENPSALQFDHVNDKEHNISDMIRHGFSIEKIMVEIKKCEVRCANCHAIKTAKDQKWLR